METITLPTIGEEPHFYGYITGIGVENSTADFRDEVPTRLYATFEYGHGTTVWCVPDHELFALLAVHLIDMAAMRSAHGEYGYSKLWIRRAHGRWEVDLP